MRNQDPGSQVITSQGMVPREAHSHPVWIQFSGFFSSSFLLVLATLSSQCYYSWNLRIERTSEIIYINLSIFSSYLDTLGRQHSAKQYLTNTLVSLQVTKDFYGEEQFWVLSQFLMPYICKAKNKTNI